MNAKAARGCLLLHDLTGQLSDVGPLMEALEEAGYPTLAPNLFGFVPRDQYDRTPLWQRTLKQAEDAYEELVGVAQSVAVLGVGMGGTIAAIIAEEYQTGGLIVVGPAMRPNAVRDRLLARLPFVKLPGAAGDIRTEDVGKLTRLAANNYYSIACDALVFSVPDDPAYASEAGQELLRAARGALKREIPLPGAAIPEVLTKHSLKIREEVLKFLEGV